MHSSRMCTVRSSSCLLGGDWSRGSAQGVAWSRDVYLAGGWGIPELTEPDTPVNRMTDRCKNITFATLLRMVISEETLPTVNKLKKEKRASLGKNPTNVKDVK